MRNTHLLAAILVLAVPSGLVAQRATTPLQTRTFVLHDLRPEDAVQLIGPYIDTEGGGVFAGKGTRNMAITVRGSARNLASVDSVLRVLDAPSPGVMLRFDLVVPADQPSQDPSLQEIQGALSRTMGVRGVRRIGQGAVAAEAHADFAVTMSGDRGRFLVSGDVGQVTDAPTATIGVQVGVTAADMVPGDSASVATNMMRAIMPGNKIVETSVTMPLGRSVVIGSGTLQQSGDTVILVVTPTLLR